MKFIRLQLLLVVLFLLAASSASADTLLSVTVDTSSLDGDAGYLYFQYVPVMAVDSTATVFNFQGGQLAPSPSLEVVDGSAVSGALPGPVTFANTNAINDYNHGITFGDSLSFLVNFSSPVFGGDPIGSSTFSLGLFADEFGLTELLGGTLFTASLGNSRTVAIDALANQASLSEVPEAGTMWLLGSGLVGLIGVGRKIRK
jgi:hypothetical protein